MQGLHHHTALASEQARRGFCTIVLHSYSFQVSTLLNTSIEDQENGCLQESEDAHKNNIVCCDFYPILVTFLLCGKPS